MTQEMLSHPVIDIHIRNKRGKSALDVAKRGPISQMLKEAARQREVCPTSACATCFCGFGWVLCV